MNTTGRKKINVIYCLTGNSFDGASNFANELCMRLSQQYNLTVIVPIIPQYRYCELAIWNNKSFVIRLFSTTKFAIKCLVSEIVRRKLRWVYHSKSNKTRIKRCWLYPREAVCREADVVILNNWYLVVGLKKIWDSERGKFLIYHHHYQQLENTTVNDLKDSIYRKSVNLVTSFSTSLQVRKKVDRAPHIIYPGIDRNVFFPKNEQESSRSNLRVGLYRGFENRKGYDLGLEAINRVKKNYQFEVAVIQGSSRYSCPEGFQVYSELSNVEMGELMRELDIFIFPSLQEGFGLPPLEAMASGCAVISTRVGAVEEYSTHLKDIYIVEPGNVDAIENALTLFIEDYKALEKLRIAAAQVGVNWYSWEQAALQSQKVIDKSAR